MSKRPTMRDPLVIADAVIELMPQLMKWSDSDPDPDRWRDALVSTLKAASYKDVFGLCKTFEVYAHVEADDGLYEILSDAHSLLDRALMKAEKHWFAASGLTPRYAVGDMMETATVRGEVVRLDMERGYYTIRDKSRQEKGYLGTLHSIEEIDSQPTPIVATVGEPVIQSTFPVEGE